MRFLSLFLIAAPVTAGDSVAPVGAAAVWNPPAGFLAAMHAACDGSPERMSECFLERMRAAGASPEAVAFTESAGGLQYLRDFRETGRVDVAWAVSPFRANTNDVIDLVNGDPAILDVDDRRSLAPAVFENDAGYGAIRAAHPSVTPFPGDRHTRRAVERSTPPGGGQRFVLGEDLRDGCHACAILGKARVAFDFDLAGKFRGLQVLKVQATRAPQP